MESIQKPYSYSVTSITSEAGAGQWFIQENFHDKGQEVLLVKMKALKCKTLGAKFASELLVGNGRWMNKSQIEALR